MSNVKKFNIQVVKKIGVALGIDWKNFNFEQFRMGLEVELEHGNSKIIRKTNPILNKSTSTFIS